MGEELQLGTRKLLQNHRQVQQRGGCYFTKKEEEARRVYLPQKCIGENRDSRVMMTSQRLSCWGGLCLAENAAYIFPYGAWSDSFGLYN